jgi:hypothetical protein
MQRLSYFYSKTGNDRKKFVHTRSIKYLSKGGGTSSASTGSVWLLIAIYKNLQKHVSHFIYFKIWSHPKILNCYCYFYYYYYDCYCYCYCYCCSSRLRFATEECEMSRMKRSGKLLLVRGDLQADTVTANTRWCRKVPGLLLL